MRIGIKIKKTRMKRREFEGGWVIGQDSTVQYKKTVDSDLHD